MSIKRRRLANNGWPVGRLTVANLRSRHPEWWVAAAAVGAWLILLLGAVAGVATHGARAHDHALGVDGSGRFAAVLGWWAVMTVAMMLPLVLPAVRRVAVSSFWHRRQRAASEFVAGYLAVWMLVGVITVGALSNLASLIGSTATMAAAFTAAAVWQLSAAKRRSLRRCSRSSPLAPTGWRAARDCARFGAVIGWSCVTSCWALMAATVTAAHTFEVMAVVFGVQLNERFRRRPAVALSAAVIAALALILVLPRALT